VDKQRGFIKTITKVTTIISLNQFSFDHGYEIASSIELESLKYHRLKHNGPDYNPSQSLKPI